MKNRKVPKFKIGMWRFTSCCYGTSSVTKLSHCILWMTIFIQPWFKLKMQLLKALENPYYKYLDFDNSTIKFIILLPSRPTHWIVKLAKLQVYIATVNYWLSMRAIALTVAIAVTDINLSSNQWFVQRPSVCRLFWSWF